MNRPQFCRQLKHFGSQNLRSGNASTEGKDAKDLGFPREGVLVFLWKLVRQRRTDVTSFCMLFEKGGCELLQEAFGSEELLGVRGSALLAEREGEIRNGEFVI